MYIPNDEDNLDTEQTEIDTEETVEEETEEEENTGEEVDADGEPADLADAFGRLRSLDASNASEDVETGDAGEDDGEDGSGDEGDLEAVEEAEAVDGEGYPDGGGSAVVAGVADYQAAQNDILTQLNRTAATQARKQFRDQGIREFTMNDIYERQSDGRVVYRNPDDPNRPFANRMEAQQWIDSFNSQVKQELNRVALKIRNDSIGSIMPALNLLAFAPTYDAMDESVREVFDDIIEDYEVKNRKGEVVGYNCDLNRMAAKAERLASKYSRSTQQGGNHAKVTKQKSGSTPALDMKSRRTPGDKGSDKEPETMEEAFKRLREMGGM